MIDDAQRLRHVQASVDMLRSLEVRVSVPNVVRTLRSVGRGMRQVDICRYMRQLEHLHPARREQAPGSRHPARSGAGSWEQAPSTTGVGSEQPTSTPGVGWKNPGVGSSDDYPRACPPARDIEREHGRGILKLSYEYKATTRACGEACEPIETLLGLTSEGCFSKKTTEVLRTADDFERINTEPEPKSEPVAQPSPQAAPKPKAQPKQLALPDPVTILAAAILAAVWPQAKPLIMGSMTYTQWRRRNIGAARDMAEVNMQPAAVAAAQARLRAYDGAPFWMLEPLQRAMIQDAIPKDPPKPPPWKAPRAPIDPYAKIRARDEAAYAARAAQHAALGAA